MYSADHQPPRDSRPRRRSFDVRCRGNRRSGFTLVEMLVSLAVLALALSVVGVVFSVTTQTATQAAAYSESLNWVRQFMLQIEADLEQCDPTKSFIVIEGRDMPAALTADGLEAGTYYRVLTGDPDQVPANYDETIDPSPPNEEFSEPRADLLTFITQRPMTSAAPASDPESGYHSGTGKFAPTLVTYGHSAIGEAVWNESAGEFQFPKGAELRHVDQTAGSYGISINPERSILPANQWFLARRAVILESVSYDKLELTIPEVRRVTYYEPDETNGLAGDVVTLNVPELLAQFNPQPEDDFYPALYSPYDFDHGNLNDLLDNLLYNDTGLHYFATILPQLPIELRSNVGLHLLPGCAWFQVEFLMPEDPRNSLEFTGDPKTSPDYYSKRYDMPRWVSVVAGERYVFVPDTPENRNSVAQDILPGDPHSMDRLFDFARIDQEPTLDPNGALEYRRIRMWPYAIRVTVRVYDPRGRLTEPIVRSFVHRFE